MEFDKEDKKPMTVPRAWARQAMVFAASLVTAERRSPSCTARPDTRPASEMYLSDIAQEKATTHSRIKYECRQITAS